MLTLTAEAVSAIREITAQRGLPAETGVRIASASPTGNGVPGLEVDVAKQPEPADQVVETDGVRVFLDPDASAVLNDKSLDAVVRETGVHFVIGGHTE